MIYRNIQTALTKAIGMNRASIIRYTGVEHVGHLLTYSLLITMSILLFLALNGPSYSVGIATLGFFIGAVPSSMHKNRKTSQRAREWFLSSIMIFEMLMVHHIAVYLTINHPSETDSNWWLIYLLFGFVGFIAGSWGSVLLRLKTELRMETLEVEADAQSLT